MKTQFQQELRDIAKKSANSRKFKYGATSSIVVNKGTQKILRGYSVKRYKQSGIGYMTAMASIQKVLLALRVRKGIKVILAPKAFKVSRVSKANLVHKVHRAFKERKVTLVKLAPGAMLQLSLLVV